jgi:tetratricopeptide (TPR) repeat protein
MNRMMEDRAATDAAYRKGLDKKGRPRLSHGRAMSDEALLAKLRALGLDVDRERLLGTFSGFISAERMAKAMIADAPSPIPDAQTDWVWIGLTCLWERWRPDLANMEMLDDKIQAGYAALEDRDCPKACRLWLEAWRAVIDLMARSGADSLDTFDSQFGATQSVFNWVQDLEMELHNAGLEEPQFFRERIALCETVIARFSGSRLFIENFQMALAQSHFELGDREEGARLFRRWLDECPQWGGGWMAWSDSNWLFAPQNRKDAATAEKILKEGLSVPGVENRTDLLDRLALIYEETGRSEEATVLRKEIQQASGPERSVTIKHKPGVIQVKQGFDFGEEGLPLDQLPNLAKSLTSARPASGDLSGRKVKVGRNQPCPCGSGKKYKKCCGRLARAEATR